MLCILLALACAAETSVAPPSIGVVRDCQGHNRRVFGMPGAFLLGPPETAKTGAVLPLPEGASIQDRTLILPGANGSERRVSLPEPATAGLQSLAHGWLAAPPFVIRLTTEGATIYRLPMPGCASRTAEAAP